MIVELLQAYDFFATGTVRGLFLLFFILISFELTARRYAKRYRPHDGHVDHKVSTVIPTWNEKPEWLRKSILSALAGSDEVIVAYSRSDKKALTTLEKLRPRFRVREIAFQRRVPKKRAVYEAVRVATGEVVIIQDSDTWAPRSAYSEILKPFQDDKVGGVVAQNIIFNVKHLAGMFSKFVEASRNLINKAFSYFGQVHVLDSRFCAYRKEAILPLMDDYLNNRFLGRDVVIGEDKMLTALLQKAGWKCVMQSTAVDYTAAPDSLAGFLKQQLRWARSGYAYLFRHYWCLKLHWLLTWHILFYFLAPIAFPLIVAYDILMTPPLLELPPVIWALILLAGVSSIALMTARLKGMHIQLREAILVGVFGLFVLLPLRLYALMTVWKQGSWISR